MNVVLFLINQLFMPGHFSNFMVDMIVLMTPGRSRASAYLQMKYIHKKLAKDNESVLLLAACRDEDSEEIVNQTFAYFEDGNVNLEIISKSDNWLDEIIARIHSEADRNSNPNVEIFFAGGEKLIYLKAYQTLSLNKNYTNVLSITEPNMATAVGFTIDDWLVANKSDNLVFIPNSETLVIQHSPKNAVMLTNLEFKQGENPTRLFCEYVRNYSVTSIEERLKPEMHSIRKGLEKINILFNKLNITNDIRLKLMIKFEDILPHYNVYFDKKFLTRNGFIYLMLELNSKIDFYGGDEEFTKRFEIIKRKLHGRLPKIAKIDRFFSDIDVANRSRNDSMKWLVPHKSKPIFNYDSTYVIDGFNGRELQNIVKNSDLSNLRFEKSNTMLDFNYEDSTILSAFILALNSHHYLSLSEEQFNNFNQKISTIKPKFRVQKKDVIYNSEFIIITKHKLSKRNVPKYDFEFSNINKTITMNNNKFCEMLYSIARMSQDGTHLFENWWIYNYKTNQINDKNNLLQQLGIFISDHSINADGYTFHNDKSGYAFEICDINSISSFNHDRVIDKYEKYEKNSSKFPFPIFTSVFSVFSRKQDSMDEQNESKQKVIDFISADEHRIWKYLDLTSFDANPNPTPVKINVKLLGRFLADRETDIHGFAEWCEFNSEVGLEILEEE